MNEHKQFAKFPVLMLVMMACMDENERTARHGLTSGMWLSTPGLDLA
jgi:hypothetical protein